MWKMFKRNSKTLEIEHIIDLKSTELKIHEFLYEHGKCMIANCIAKSDIYTIEDGKNVKNQLYYLLNVRPNRNETATEFWAKVIDRYYSSDGEVLIVNIGDYLYVADSFSKSNDVIKYQTFYNVSISIDGSSIALRNTFTAENSIFIRRIDKKIDRYLDFVNDKYTDLMIAVINGYMMKAPKFYMKIPNGLRLVDKENKPITTNSYVDDIAKKIKLPDTSIFNIPDQISLQSIKSESSVSSQEMKDIYNQAAQNVAMALNIPLNAFLGTITEKSDAIDEMITFAVQIIVEQLNDALNHALMEKETYLAKNYVRFNLSKSKHRDIVSSASSIDKLIGDGFSHNQILDLFDIPEIDEDWANQHHITKNYANTKEMKGGDSGE